jgi:Dehydrogenase E1 component
MPTSKPKHKQAHEAVNTPPSRNPDLMRRMYMLLAKCRAECRGIEATVVGSLMGLLPEDTLTIAHARSLATTLYPKKLAPEVLDFAALDRKSPELSATAHISLASGYALERALHHRPGLILAFAGEADSLAEARATLTFAATHKLPLVMVVQHNLARTKSGSPGDLTHEMLGVGLAGMTVDGTDAMAVYRVTQEAMFRARHDAGPTLIECKTYPKRKVPPRLRAWVQGDALQYMEQQLRARNFWHGPLRA